MQSASSYTKVKSVILTGVILSVWLTVVVYTVTKHEFWRDEVRALSEARAAVSPVDLYRLTQYDGHPVLWYLLLYIGYSIFRTPEILPITSVLIAFTAVAVFMVFAPFPLWFRCLFIFSSLPFYEYSVIARNYGVSMLLLFIAAALYPYRDKYPLLLALVLFLLANTNVHSVMLVCLITAIWAWDDALWHQTLHRKSRRSLTYLPLAIIIAGVLLCAIFTIPRDNTILLSLPHSVGIREFTLAVIGAFLRPDRTFSAILPRGLPPFLGAGLLYATVLGLIRRPPLFLAALSGQIAFGVFFRVVYPGFYRHQGIFVIFIVFLYWVSMDGGAGAFRISGYPSSLSLKSIMGRTKQSVFILASIFPLLAIILGNVAQAKQFVLADIRGEKSSSKAFGEFLKDSDSYRNAIIVPEPDYLVESLPYYTNNMIYLPREHRFGTTVSWTTASKIRLSLGDLLSIAREIKITHDQPVLVVLGHWDVGRYRLGDKKYSYNKVFTWSVDELVDFETSTLLVAEFKAADSDENYRVYTIR